MQAIQLLTRISKMEPGNWARLAKQMKIGHWPMKIMINLSANWKADDTHPGHIPLN